MILAGDIGGTHARLAFFDVEIGKFRLVTSSVYPSREHVSLDEIVVNFVKSSGLQPASACFGVPGPVRKGRVETSNLPWVIESERLSHELGLVNVELMNDLEAEAWGIPVLEAKDVVPLNQVKATLPGNQAVIAAGTGLGQAGLYWDGSHHRVFACEGGHADFAPRGELEMELLRYLQTRYGHVSYERIVSGPGLVNVYHFLRDTHRGTESPSIRDAMSHGDPAAVICGAGVASTCPMCEQALDIFVSVFAAEGGNLALKLMATGGIFLGGGIAPKMLPKLSGPLFMHSFVNKGRMQTLLETIPVSVIVNDKTALLGAARYSQEHMTSLVHQQA